MLCKERGIFLEIADQIRGLGLTILKGVMEVRKDKIWARFAVEVLNLSSSLFNLVPVLMTINFSAKTPSKITF
jgi:hypothetical protein